MPDKSRFDQHGQKVIGQQINVAGDATLSPLPLVLIPHLPAPPRDFTGRDEELQDLLGSFERGATITGLRGMGGIGKTALAYALAEKLAVRYPNGQILIELRGTSPEPMTAGEAMARVVRAYHPEFKPPESEAELAGIYRSLLHDLRILLLLDNAASREQVEPLLPPPGCAVIVTSRNRFAMPGLKAKDLDVLPLEDAKKLLLDIADRIGSQAEELAKLCGCLPIALRNAAYVLADRKDLGVAEYLERLQEARNRVDLVEASFGLSYDLLSPELRRLWCLLSVFPPGAGFDREGAAAVWALDQDSAASSLSDLVKWSLVEFDPAIRRYRLHDLARDFADSRLPSREKGEAEERHAEHYRSVLSASDDLYMQGGDSLQAGLTLFDREWANIQAGQSWAEKKLENSPAAASLCSLYPNAGAYLLDLRLHPKDKIRWRKTAVAAARQLKDLIAVGAHLGNLASAYYSLGEPLKAIEHYQQALAIAREFGDRHGEGYHLSSLGLVHAEVGDIRRAIEYYRQALVIAREIVDRRSESACLGSLGLTYAYLGEPRKAIEYYQQALAIAREIGYQRGEEVDMGNLGAAYADLGEPRKAIEYYEQALAIAREIGDRRGEGNRLFNMSLAQDSLGKRSEAVKLAKEALAIYEQIESPYAEKVRQQLAEWQGES
jgi:tetratricopeptide (TPR) repeat protein